VWASLLALDVFVPVPFLGFSRSCWRFFFPSVFRLVPFWFLFLFRSRPPSGGGGVPPVVLAISFCWALPCGGGGVRGGVVFFSSFLFSFSKGGWVGAVGWLFYYQI
jgi:hypothetical protein